MDTPPRQEWVYSEDCDIRLYNTLWALMLVSVLQGFRACMNSVDTPS
jgi:hypothetical protein